MEPNINVELIGNGRGQIGITIKLTPDQLLESHEFLGEIDQTHLPEIARACRAILENYPLREPEKMPDSSELARARSGA